jgi:hypothetical protein
MTMSHLVGFHTWSTVSASQKPFRRPNSTTSISTTRHHLHTGTPPKDMENIKQSYYTVRLAGASLFLVGEDATSQLRTPFTNNIHLFNKQLPFHSLPSPMYFNTFSFIFASFHFYLRRFSSVFPFTKTIRFDRLSFASAPLCRINQSSNEKQQSTSYKRQQTTQLNSIKQSVTKDNRRSSSPCRRHCLSVVSNVRSHP